MQKFEMQGSTTNLLVVYLLKDLPSLWQREARRDFVIEIRSYLFSVNGVVFLGSPVITKFGILCYYVCERRKDNEHFTHPTT